MSTILATAQWIHGIHYIVYDDGKLEWVKPNGIKSYQWKYTEDGLLFLTDLSNGEIFDEDNLKPEVVKTIKKALAEKVLLDD